MVSKERFKELIVGDKTITNQSKIIAQLESNDLDWLIDQSLEDASIEIKNKTLIWHDGYFSGDWHYGIFKNGIFHGTFRNGIFENGKFNGKFISGIKL